MIAAEDNIKRLVIFRLDDIYVKTSYADTRTPTRERIERL